MTKIIVNLKRLPHGEDLPLPRYMTDGASGMDLYAAVEQKLAIHPGETVLVPTGIAVAIPRGYEIQVRPRSGLAFKHGMGILNSPGTIDSDYRGEIKIIMINLGNRVFELDRGTRIAQMVLQKVNYIDWREVEELSETERNAGGFGHTGHK